jgi:hypothetical protein
MHRCEAIAKCQTVELGPQTGTGRYLPMQRLHATFRPSLDGSYRVPDAGPGTTPSVIHPSLLLL